MSYASLHLGLAGEEAAAIYLQQQGYTILGRNISLHSAIQFGQLRLPGKVTAELDIVALQGNILVFVEVKTRRGDSCGSPQESITRPKMARMRRAAEHYLARCTVPYSAVRFDAVCLSAGAQGWIVQHLHNIQ